MSDALTAAAPRWPQQWFLADVAAGGGGICAQILDPNQLGIVTFISVVYLGTGSGAPLISFEVNGQTTVWASAPQGGTVHTEQFPCFIVLTSTDVMTVGASAGNWGVCVSGYATPRQ